MKDLTALDAALEAAQKKMAAVDSGRAALREGFLRVAAGDVEGASDLLGRATLRCDSRVTLASCEEGGGYLCEDGCD